MSGTESISKLYKNKIAKPLMPSWCFRKCFHCQQILTQQTSVSLQSSQIVPSELKGSSNGRRQNLNKADGVKQTST